jgi:hypothetical protein
MTLKDCGFRNLSPIHPGTLGACLDDIQTLANQKFGTPNIRQTKWSLKEVCYTIVARLKFGYEANNR